MNNSGVGTARVWVSRWFERARAVAGRADRAAVLAPRTWTDFRLLPLAAMIWLMSWAGVRLPMPEALMIASVIFLLIPGYRVLGALLGKTCSGRRNKGQLNIGRLNMGRLNIDRFGRALRRGTASATLVFILGGFAVLSASAQSAQRISGPLGEAVAQRQTIATTVLLAEDPRSSALRGRVFFGARITQARLAGAEVASGLKVQVIAGAEWAQFRRGDSVRTVGVLAPAESGDLVAARLSPRSAPQKLSGASGLESWLTELRDRFVSSSQQVWGSTLPDAAALLPGMVFGDRSLQSPDLLEAMKTTGLTHLTAVSGTNCSIVLAGIILLARSFRISRLWTAGLAGAGLLAFVALVGPDPSVLRAATMGALGIFGWLTGRVNQAGPLLCSVTVILLLVDPWLSGNFGFILSVLATGGLIGLGPPLQRWLGRLLPDWLAALLSIPLSAQLTVAPVIVLLQPRLTSYAVPANVLAAPVIVACTIAGILSLCLLAVLPWAALGLIAVAGLGAAWIAVVAGFFEALPGASLPWWEGWLGVLAMLVLSALILGLVAFLAAGPQSRDRLGTMISGFPGGRLLCVLIQRVEIVAWLIGATLAVLTGAWASRFVIGMLLPLPP